MSTEELSESRNELLATYGGTVIETICRELTAIDNPGTDPDLRPRATGGLPWWTMKIGKALKYRPLFEKAWDEGAETAWNRSTPEVNGTRYHWRHEGEPVNPYRQEKDA